MPRLTFRADCDSSAQSCEPINCIDDYSYAALRDVMGRLAAYEDTGLTPEEIEKYRTHSELVSRLNNCNDCGITKNCAVRPQLGKTVRINCAMWRGLEEPNAEH